MEILCRRRAVANLHVVFRAELQEPFNARAGMFRSLAFKPMRQQQHQSTRLIPFRFRRTQELINNDLGAVHKIAKLCFPEHQRQRVGHTVAEFKTHHRVFAQQAVNGLKLGLVRLQVLERHVTVAAFVIVELKVPLRKRTAPHIFAAQANGRSFHHQTAERQHLCKTPVDGRALERIAPPFQQRLQLRM